MSSRQIELNIRDIWSARWVWHPDGESGIVEMMRFRRSFTRTKGGCGLTIHISADSRYRLWVNDTFVGRGPCKGDLQSYSYETYDVTALLKTGRNVIAVEVLSFHQEGPVSEVHRRGGLIVQASVKDSDGEEMIDVSTGDGSWLVDRDEAFRPHSIDWKKLLGWVGLGFMERLDGRLVPEGWRQPEFDDTGWLPAEELPWAAAGFRRGNSGLISSHWGLVERPVLMLEEVPKSFKRLYGIDSFPLRIGPNTRKSFILDAGELTTGYVRLCLREGEGSSIKLTYAEALMRDGKKVRSRDYEPGDVVLGYSDEYVASGRDEHYETFFWKTFRYVLVEVETRSEPLEIADISYVFTSYPFEMKAEFASSDEDTERFWEISWRTLKLCSHETYEDCPYYEQLQYIGDSRLSALLSYYLSNDSSLARRAVLSFHDSMLPEGITRSNYPSNNVQVIPPFSLFWIQMVKDYFLHTGDGETLRYVLPGVERVLDWFDERLDANGLVGQLPWWNFVDWCAEYPRTGVNSGVPPEVLSGGSTTLSLQYAVTIADALSLDRMLGTNQLSGKWRRVQSSLVENAIRLSWREDRGLFADGPGSASFSQHANIWALLSEDIPPEMKKSIVERITGDQSLIRTTFYYTFYFARALAAAGRYELLWPRLDEWREMIAMGLSTWGEDTVRMRSDCHAWSAWPSYDFLAEVLGIRPASPGFGSILVEPRETPLQWARGSMETPVGRVSIDWRKEEGILSINGETPKGIRTVLRFKEHEEETEGGKFALRVPLRERREVPVG